MEYLNARERGCSIIMMKTLFAAAFAAALLSTPALAQVSTLSGAWRLSAKVASVPFKLLCTFDQTGDRLSGVCQEPSGHKAHPLTGGVVQGDRVTFKHEGRFLLNTFDVNYAGVVDGDTISGQIDVFGHTGDFTAVREGS
jgi:hypothetical protein